MRNFITFMLTSIMVAFSACGYAQKVKIIEGDPGVVLDEKSINIIFEYDSMKISRFEPKNSNYMNKATRQKEWTRDREDLYEPAFNKNFEKYSGIKVAPDIKDTKYSLIYKTVFLKAGDYSFNEKGGSAKTNAEAWLVENNTEKVVAKISILHSHSNFFGNNNDRGLTIAASYANAAKALGKYIKTMQVAK